MATVTDAGGQWDTNATNHTVTATPAVGDLIVIVHGMSGWAGGDTSSVSDNNSGGGGSYAIVGGNPISNGGGTACALWISVRNSLITSNSSTVFTETSAGDTGGGLSVYFISGMSRTGALAVRQTVGESTQTESPVVITFPVATLTTNPIILGCMGEDNPAALGPPASFTESEDTGWATPTTGIHGCFVSSGQTASQYTYASGAFTDHNEAGVELDTSPPPTEAFSQFRKSGGMIGLRWR